MRDPNHIGGWGQVESCDVKKGTNKQGKTETWLNLHLIFLGLRAIHMKNLPMPADKESTEVTMGMGESRPHLSNNLPGKMRKSMKRKQGIHYANVIWFGRGYSG